MKTKARSVSTPSALPRLDQRGAGLLLHITSLPGRHGSGDLGPAATAFVDFLHRARLAWWQMLPITPPCEHGCPYSSDSAFAGNPMLINLDELANQGLLSREDVQPVLGFHEQRVNFDTVQRYRMTRLRKAYDNFKAAHQRKQHDALAHFREQQAYWLEDYALFRALKTTHGPGAWQSWPKAIRERKPAALRDARTALADEIDFVVFTQWVFEQQWLALKRYARHKGVALLGDIPIFIAYDSADVWAQRALFVLAGNGRPRVVSGAAPDAFNRDGQRWGHPLYDWPAHRKTDYAWWTDRFRRTFEQFDAARVDHFLGFVRYWEVSAPAKTARRGRWRPGPGAALFDAVQQTLGELPIVAEDLGIVTPQAIRLLDKLKLPGMRVLQFAFGQDDSMHQPHNHPRRCVVYTGTHDNDTIVGWWRNLKTTGHRNGSLNERQRALLYGSARTGRIHWDMIRLAMTSVANLCIIPVQDVLGLAGEARMNTPGTDRGNWAWRMKPNALTRSHAGKLHQLAKVAGRMVQQEQEKSRKK